ncbi:MAG: hypothetical protein SOZ80_00075 [Prevotella sp.]|uniref:hypothetical protein n=1 Tax=Prevotella sp. TaxID=59823 RepID=UPI002A2FE8D4|nr:hypothetical protein [Prevotella sp.]MDD7317497.1 hypothetical protein [Prevotellaceae bacterium]MDY4019167.1 hypothetical protein [Prevotella sp.]
MRKTLFSVLSVLLITSCTGSLKKKINEMLDTDGATSENAVAPSDAGLTTSDNINDLPLFAVAEYGTHDWYVPVDFCPVPRFTDEELNSLSEAQQKEEEERTTKEVDAFIDMLKKNKERYVTLLSEGKKVALEYVSENLDMGSTGTIAFSVSGDERDESMKYLRFTKTDRQRNRRGDNGLLLTEKFLKTHRLLDFTNKYDGRKFVSGKPLSESARMNIERQTDKRVKSARLNCEIDGGRYCFYTVIFENSADKAFAMQVVTTPEFVSMGEMEDAPTDDDGKAEWAVGTTGEYPVIDILMAEEHDGTLSLWYSDTAAEQIRCGVFTVNGNKVAKRGYYSYHIW